MLFASGASPSRAQAVPPVTLEGVVADTTGARIEGAKVNVLGHGAVLQVHTDRAGHFALRTAPGAYLLTVASPGFESFQTRLNLAAGSETPPIRAILRVASLNEEIVVDDDATNGAAGASKGDLVFSGQALNMFSQDNDTFRKQILAFAGAGPQAPQVYINGFTGGRFPPRNTIREVRLNRNPYSALFDRYGQGRVEIFTNPGGGKLHGELDGTGNDIAFNATNPYSGPQPAYYSYTLNGSLNGPLGKKASFFLAGTYNDQQNNAPVDAYTLDPVSLQPVHFTDAVPNPSTVSTYSLRLDRLVTANNTFTGSYEFNQTNQSNGAIGQLTLPSQGFNSGSTSQTLQLSDTQLIGLKMVTETRFQYIRSRLRQDPIDGTATVSAEGSFEGGGNPLQQLRDNQDAFEFQQYVSRQQGAHFLRAGGRYRLYRDGNLSRANFNGQFLFPSLTAYQITQQGIANGESDAQIRATCAPQPTGPPICGGATQYSVTRGSPSATALTGDLAVFAEDEWKARKNLTVDLGFRFESQTGVPDHIDPGPRLGFAWLLQRKGAKTPLVLLRAGAGVFYDRFTVANLLTANRLNGTRESSYFERDPDFKNPSVAAAAPSTYTLSPNLRSEYGIYTGFGAERMVPHMGRISATYTYVRGDHQYLSRNANAPLPGTFDPANPASGIRPLGGNANVYQFDSGGTVKSNTLYVTSQLNLTKRANGYIVYRASSVRTDAEAANNFVSNSFNPSADYSRAAQPRQALNAGGNMQLPYGITGNLYLQLLGGVPFNITTGTDLNGDTIYNDRPTFATDLTRASVVQTRFGNFDTVPTTGQQLVPRNYGNSPNNLFLGFILGRSFAFGPRPPAPAKAAGPAAAPAEPPYTLNVSVEAQNPLNQVNRGIPVGVLSSPFFGRSIALASGYGPNTAANRSILLHMALSF